MFWHLQAGLFRRCDACNKKEKEKKGGGKNIPRESIYGLHAAARSMPVISLWVKEGSPLCADWRPHVETMGGTWARGAHGVDAGSCCHQDLAMAPLFCLLARQGWGRARTVFGCMLKGCANVQD